ASARHRAGAVLAVRAGSPPRRRRGPGAARCRAAARLSRAAVGRDGESAGAAVLRAQWFPGRCCLTCRRAARPRGGADGAQARVDLRASLAPVSSSLYDVSASLHTVTSSLHTVTCWRRTLTRSLSRRDPHPCVSNCRSVGLAGRSGTHVLATSVGGLDPDEERCLLAMCGAGLVDAGAGDS